MSDTVTIRTDTDTMHALEVLTHGGISRSAAIRQAIIEAGMRVERAAAMKRATLQMDLGKADGIDIAQLIAAERNDKF